MSKIRRSLQGVTGDLTVTEGDIIVSEVDKGVVMEDNVGDSNRMKIVDDDGVKTIEVETI